MSQDQCIPVLGRLFRHTSGTGRDFPNTCTRSRKIRHGIRDLVTELKFKSESISIFGHFEYDFADRWTIITGACYIHEKHNEIVYNARVTVMRRRSNQMRRAMIGHPLAQW